MAVVSGNIAHANTTVTPGGEPYRKREVTFASVMSDEAGSREPGLDLGGVKVGSVSVSQEPLQQIYRPGHPQADKNGFVKMPNVNVTEEMVDMVNAQRAYEANLSAMKTYRDMLRNSLSILK